MTELSTFFKINYLITFDKFYRYNKLLRIAQNCSVWTCTCIVDLYTNDTWHYRYRSWV